MQVSLNRLSSQAEDLALFHKIISCDENSLDIQFRSRHASILRQGTRGYGYWIWKPRVILDCLSRMRDGDVLLYSDAGCHLNPGGRDRLLEYFQMVRGLERGMLLFKYFPSSFDGIAGHLRKIEYMNWRNRQWCKGDLLDYFGLRNDHDFLGDYIVSAGIILVRKCPFSTAILEKWLETMEFDYSLINDLPSKTSNSEGFVESRHDQAVLSCIAYREGLDSISAYETDAPPANGVPGKDWSALDKYPVHARRDRR